MVALSASHRTVDVLGVWLDDRAPPRGPRLPRAPASPMESPEHHATRLLRRAGSGDAQAASELLTMLYGELKRLAAQLMRGEATGHTLQATALVHESWMKLAAAGALPMAEDRAHFLRLAARAMRRVLVDHARTRDRAKRGGGAVREPLDDVVDAITRGSDLDLVALNDALERLGQFDERGARIVELRLFAGLSIDESAKALGVSTPTIERGWRVARLWLSRELGSELDGEG